LRALELLLSCDDWSRRDEGCHPRVYDDARAKARAAIAKAKGAG
jgi:hypothetical protein